MAATTRQLRQMLRERYGVAGYRYALFEEVHDATGYRQSRSCDALVMCLWPSDGLEIHGFEIKQNRADYLNEIRDPDKAEAFKKHCDRWWLVASSRSVVKNDLPQGWGMMWPRAGKLVVSTGAPKLKPEPMPRRMLAALLRRAAEGNADREAMNERYEAGIKQGEKWAEQRLGRDKEALAKLREKVAAFEEASGIQLHGYGRDGASVGAAVECVLKMQGRFGAIGRLLNTAASLGQHADSLRHDVLELVKAAKAAGIQGELGFDLDQ
ncbi:MAG: hypothetical protein GTN69_10640 [Armatimonadetes bacterium]|nr:hypothetical protein [Armatimonadota bacterium]